MSKSLDRLERDIYSISQRVNQEGSKYNAFLLENAFATISTAIEAGVRLYQIDLASPGLKAKILRYSKFALTYPDGSNPTIIELKVATLPAGYQTIDIYVNGQGLWEQDIFPAFGYPVGSLISGLDYEANSVLAAAGGEDATGGDVQYYWGGFLTGSSGSAPQGSPYDFKFNPASGVVTAGGGFNSAGLITSKQRHVIHCGFAHATASNVYLPFGYGGIFDSTSSSGYLEYGGFIAPCNGYVEFITVRGENAGGTTSVAINVAGPHVEVPSLGPGSFSGGNVDMASDDVAYKWDTFTNQGGQSNSFNAGDVIMISMNTSFVLHDAIATAVLVLDWNNPL